MAPRGFRSDRRCCGPRHRAQGPRTAFGTMPVKVAVAFIGALAFTAVAEEIGTVDTAFQLLGPDHKVAVDAFDDEQVQGVACHVSRAVSGGLTSMVGLAEDTSDASIACRQVGPIRISGKLDAGDPVFSERRSALFKRLSVVRFCDETRNTLVYLVYSEKLVDGSPKNAISTVPIMPWPGDETPLARCDDGQ